MSTKSVTKKKAFDPKSPGFLYTLVVGALTIFTVSGVHFPDSNDAIAGSVVSSLSTGGIYAIIGIIISSVAFPIYNAVKSGLKFNMTTIFGSTLTWVAIGNIILSLLALVGFVLPDGTVEQIVGAIAMKDWVSLGGLVFTTIVPTLVRWIKDRKNAAIAAGDLQKN